MPSTVEQRQTFLDWITANVPKIEDYFGLDHLNQWVKDGLSREYNLFYDMWTNNPDSVYGSFVARLTGMNPNYASFMAKAKNSGDMLRAEIAVIQNELTQTTNQETMWSGILKSNTTPGMKVLATSLLQSYTEQEKQVSTTLSQYQKDLSDGLKSGIYV